MAKLALCTTAEAIETKSWEDWPLSLEDRAIVDDVNNLNPAIQQLIPYVVFRSMVQDNEHLLTYVRGTSGGESRLHGKLSVGAGGHMDTLPEHLNLVDHIVLETLRETKEELGVWLSADRLACAVENAIEWRQFIRRQDTPVDTVHFGILVVYTVTEEEIDALESSLKEKDIIDDVRWEDRAVLNAPDFYPRLETWSKHVVTWMQP